MTTITKIIPSGSAGSPDGTPIKIVATATAGTLFHTADATKLDEVTMYVTNTDTVDRKITVEFGGATAPDFNIVMTIPAWDTALVIPGIPLTNSKTVKAFAAAANVLCMFGYINRIG
jgi:hypothetical protein